MAMKPIYFNGCFGWLHTPPSGTQGTPRAGAVLCAAFAQEEICTHYGMMALADELAAMGMPTIRFDYRGTANSIASDVSLASLVADVEHASAYLRNHCAVGTVALAGLRLGAALALHAAASMPSVGAVVLMAPALSGSAFMRETRASAKISGLSGFDPVPTMESGLPLNTNGFHWSGSLQQEISSLNLTTAPPLKAPTLLLPARGDRSTRTFLETWRAADAPITELPFPDYEEWMKDPTTSVIPVETFTAIRTWLSSLDLSSEDARTPVETSELGVLLGDTFVEEPIQFGRDGVLFGILCRPRDRVPARVAALLLHEGSSHHIGDGGAYVGLARRLAEMGTASLRMDLTGMGDSPAGDNPRHPHYDPERIAEALAGIDLLESRGCPVTVAFGLCSGAYTALEVTLADKRVIGNVLVNIQKFIWHYGDDIRVGSQENRRSFKGYLRALRNPGERKRIMDGGVDIKSVITVLIKRTARGVYNSVRSTLPPAEGSETARVHQKMRALAKRSVASNLIFSDDDPGLAEMLKQFGRKARRLAAFAPARMVLLHDADHHFNGSSVRRRYNELAVSIMKNLIAEYGEGTPQTHSGRERRRRPRQAHYQEG
jgi:pimeloyl-ACP methyl ester carboxylesterase